VSLPVRTTPEADAQIRAIDDWWRKNRTAAPDVFTDELAASFNLIAQAPNIGRLYLPSPVPGARRILLKGSRYHVYYVPSEHEVRVLAVWHAQRGVGPPLRES
jgi:plasmid stabilization system protein ParE